MPNLYIHALGCKTNHYENEALAHQLQAYGFNLSDSIEDAQVGILNTCTVTAEAGRKSRQFLRRIKKRNPDIFLVAMGCYSQLEDVSELADLVIGTANRKSALGLIVNKFKQDLQDFPIELEDDLLAYEANPSKIGQASREKNYEELGLVEKQTDTRAQIKIQDGCNAFCTYCAIPLARGRVRSRLRENIFKEAQLLVENGHKEIVLTGIHICSFEKEQGRSSKALAELCLELNDIPGLERIRLGSLEPLSVSDEFLNILRKADKVCPHFHLSLQSGSDSVLKRMKRLYSTGEYRQVVKRIREIYDRPAITTDIMIGFPEETDEEFQKSLSFVQEISFAELHVFPYSIRPGTLAAKMEQVDSQIVKERARQMLTVAKALKEQYAKTFEGQKVKVLFEDLVDEMIRGYTDRYMRVYINKNEDKIGEIKEVFINKSCDGDLFGEIV